MVLVTVVAQRSLAWGHDYERCQRASAAAVLRRPLRTRMTPRELVKVWPSLSGPTSFGSRAMHDDYAAGLTMFSLLSLSLSLVACVAGYRLGHLSVNLEL